MFTDDKSIENAQRLFAEFRKYLELQKEYVRLETTEKLSILLSTLVLVLLLVGIGLVVLFHLSFAAAYLLVPLVGSLSGSFALIAAFHVLVMVLLYAFRKKWIVTPTVRFLSRLFIVSSTPKE